MVTGIIMAAGESKRFGTENKLLAPLCGKPLFEYILETAQKSDLDALIVVTQTPQILTYCKIHKIPVLHNPNAKDGQSTSIHLGVAHSKKESALLFLVADQPLLSSAIINQICTLHMDNQDKIIIPTQDEIPCNPRLFPCWTREHLLKLSGDMGGREVTKAFPEKTIFAELVAPDYTFYDIDTKKDLLTLEKVLNQHKI